MAEAKRDLLKEIKEDTLYKKDVVTRNKKARKEIEEYKMSTSTTNIAKFAIPGQLISFNYLTPKNKEELEYYDAQPVVLFFNAITTEEGKRILGFNLHYYPPKIRFQVLSKIYELFSQHYDKSLNKKTNTGILSQKIPHFDYRKLVEELDKAGLGFGVRMYIPTLVRNTKVIPQDLWVKAVYTEGMFKKKTREAILGYWKQWVHKRR